MQNWYTIAGIGTEGVEMLTSSTEMDKIKTDYTGMKLSARINAHRHIKFYAWIEDYEVTFKRMDDTEYKEHVMKNAVMVVSSIRSCFAGRMIKCQDIH